MPIRGIILILFLAVLIGVIFRHQLAEWFTDEFEDEDYEELEEYQNEEENEDR